MADSKVSELTAATSVAASDVFYVVSSGDSKKVTTANIFKDVATATSFSGTVSLAGTNTMNSAGSISLTTNVTLITNPSATGVLSIGSGSSGQIKTIIMTNNTGGHTLSLQDSQLGHNQIDFVNAGDTAQLIYTNDRWYCIGGTAAVS